MVEICGECRFDQSAYPWTDLMGSLRALGPRLRLTIEGVDPVVLNTRPAPEVWSPLEYADHMRGVLFVWRAVVLLTLDGTPEVSGDPPAGAAGGDEPKTLDPEALLASFSTEAEALHDLVALLDADALARSMTVNGDDVDINWQVAHAVHDCQHHLSDIGRGMVALGVGAPTMTGSVTTLHSSDGGVPKREIAEAVIGYRGVEGDRQRTRKHHGRVWQALCLWSSEVIDALANEGHPISEGAAGENITVSGIGWSALRPGTRVRLGDDVLVELTVWAQPCHHNSQWFSDGDEMRIDHDRHPGNSRMYAAVLRDGVVRPGDVVEVEPPVA